MLDGLFISTSYRNIMHDLPAILLSTRNPQNIMILIFIVKFVIKYGNKLLIGQDSSKTISH